MSMWSQDERCEDWLDKRIQPGQVGKLKSRVRDPALSQAELPKVILASVPIRLAGETDTEALAEEQDSAAQREQTEETVNERAKAEITHKIIPST